MHAYHWSLATQRAVGPDCADGISLCTLAKIMCIGALESPWNCLFNEPTSRIFDKVEPFQPNTHNLNIPTL